MNAHSKYRSDGFHLPTLTRWLVIAAFLGAIGLSYVYLSNQLDASCAQRKVLEQNLQDLIAQNNGLESQMHNLATHSALQRRVDEGFIKLVPISSQAVMRVRPQESGRWSAATRNQDNQFQTISQDGFPRQ